MRVAGKKVKRVQHFRNQGRDVSRNFQEEVVVIVSMLLKTQEAVPWICSMVSSVGRVWVECNGHPQPTAMD
jgi:hypothetical protein